MVMLNPVMRRGAKAAFVAHFLVRRRLAYRFRATHRFSIAHCIRRRGCLTVPDAVREASGAWLASVDRPGRID